MFSLIIFLYTTQKLKLLFLEVKGAGGYGNDDDHSDSEVVDSAANGSKTPKTPKTPTSPKESIYGSDGDLTKANPSAKPSAADKGLGTVRSGTYMTQFGAGQGPTKGKDSKVFLARVTRTYGLLFRP